MLLQSVPSIWLCTKNSWGPRWTAPFRILVQHSGVIPFFFKHESCIRCIRCIFVFRLCLPGFSLKLTLQNLGTLPHFKVHFGTAFGVTGWEGTTDCASARHKWMLGSGQQDLCWLCLKVCACSQVQNGTESPTNVWTTCPLMFPSRGVCTGRYGQWH